MASTKVIGKVLSETSIFFDSNYFSVSMLSGLGGGYFSGTMDDILDGTQYVKTENNFTDEEKAKINAVSWGKYF